MTDRPLSQADTVLAESLGILLAEAKQQFLTEARRDLELIKSESRAAINEIRLAAIEILIEQRAPPETVERLKSIVGGRR